MSIPVVHQTSPNPCAALENRLTFDALGVTCVNVVGPTGAGKTSLLEATLPRLKRELKIGLLEGDLASTHDAQRLAPLALPTVQVLTDGQSHLSADQVQKGIAELPLTGLDLLVIENIGGAVLPAGTWLGEHLRVVVASVASGDHLAIKYPSLFTHAQLVLLSKHDLLDRVAFDLETAVRRIRRLSEEAEVICTDTRHRVGIDRAAGWLLGYVRAQRMRRWREERTAPAVEMAN
jgi:hydrogenase nickel incorporation protein HypB